MMPTHRQVWNSIPELMMCVEFVSVRRLINFFAYLISSYQLHSMNSPRGLLTQFYNYSLTLHTPMGRHIVCLVNLVIILTEKRINLEMFLLFPDLLQITSSKAKTTSSVMSERLVGH